MAKTIKVKVIQAPPFPPDDDEIKDRKKAHKLNVRGFWVNTALALLALGALVFAMIQTNSAVKSVDLADSVFRLTKEYNDSTLAANRKNSISDSIENRNRFRIDSMGLNAQINALNDSRLYNDSLLKNQNKQLQQSQIRFEIENSPDLQIENFNIHRRFLLHYHNKVWESDIVPDSLLGINPTWWITKISFDVANLGKHRVKIISQRFGLYTKYVDGIFKLDTTFNEFWSKLSRLPAIKNSIFVTNSRNVEVNDFKVNTEKNHPNYFTDVFPFYIGEIMYKNVITGQTRIFKFLIKIKGFERNQYDLLYSENLDIT